MFPPPLKSAIYLMATLFIYFSSVKQGVANATLRDLYIKECKTQSGGLSVAQQNNLLDLTFIMNDREILSLTKLMEEISTASQLRDLDTVKSDLDIAMSISLRPRTIARIRELTQSVEADVDSFFGVLGPYRGQYISWSTRLIGGILADYELETKICSYRLHASDDQRMWDLNSINTDFSFLMRYFAEGGTVNAIGDNISFTAEVSDVQPCEASLRHFTIPQDCLSVIFSIENSLIEVILAVELNSLVALPRPTEIMAIHRCIIASVRKNPAGYLSAVTSETVIRGALGAAAAYYGFDNGEILMSAGSDAVNEVVRQSSGNQDRYLLNCIVTA